MICKAKISDLTSHEHVKITSSGNNSIFIALSAVEGDIIVPDQGGWHGFKQIAKFLGKNIKSIMVFFTGMLLLVVGASFVNAGYAENVIALTSSHFASAEKEFRYPLEYGNQRPLSASWTVTGSAAFVLSPHPRPSRQ